MADPLSQIPGDDGTIVEEFRGGGGGRVVFVVCCVVMKSGVANVVWGVI